MAKLNLLPWREARRQERKKEFFATMGLIFGAALLVLFGVYTFINGQIELQEQRNQRLRDEIAQLEKEIAKIKDLDATRARLLARKEIIERLQAQRSTIVHVFHELAANIPEGVVLTSMKQSGDTITLEGRAQSPARVSQYMRSLERSPWLKDVELGIVEDRPEDLNRQPSNQRDANQSTISPESNVFVLQVKLEGPNEGESVGDVVTQGQAS